MIKLKSNKAFTLIELLAIIVVLGVITIVAVPSIATSNKKMKERDYNEFCQTVKNAAEIYVETHQDKTEVINLKAGTSSYEIPVEDLIATGLLNSNLKNPNTNSPVSGSVTATKSGSKINYTFNPS